MPNTFIPIQTYTLSATASSVTFSNIPQNYTDLKLELSMRSTGNLGGGATYFDVSTVSFNGSTTISQQQVYGNGSSTFAGTGATLQIHCPGSGATANTFGNASMYIPNYTSVISKYVSIDLVTENNATNALDMFVAGLWSTSSPLTSIGLTAYSGSFAIGSTFTLYGISNGVKATGGTLTVTGGYAYHTFTSTGSFLPSQKITGAEVLCIAGGGGGGADRGGGGGAGGLRYLFAQTLNAGNSYTALVGAGGSGGPYQANGSKGGNSVFANISATGGGFGGGTTGNGGAGGSGGGPRGGAVGNLLGGSGNEGGYSPVEGFAGGADQNDNLIRLGGGGGGAGEAGNTDGQGTGGDGTSAFSTWATITSTGLGGFYAGGGSAGSLSGGSVSAGVGGGGTGVSSGNGTAGTANTGSGGGGGGDTGGLGGAGGSGLIIVRYPLS